MSDNIIQYSLPEYSKMVCNNGHIVREKSYFSYPRTMIVHITDAMGKDLFHEVFCMICYYEKQKELGFFVGVKEVPE